MRRITFYITILVLAHMLCLGVACALAGDYRQTENKIREMFMLKHINMVCDANLNERDIIYVGTHNDTYWYYTPLNSNCQWTGEYSNVWALPISYTN